MGKQGRSGSGGGNMGKKKQNIRTKLKGFF